MFTGLVEDTVSVLACEPVGGGARLTLAAPRLRPGQPPWEPKLGESLAVAGCCLTLVELGPAGELRFDLSSETLRLTWFGELVGAPADRRVNLERSVRLADRMGGHLVQGHVDGVGRILAIDDSGDGGRRFTFEVPPGFERYLIQKGSVTIDGVSLTVVDPEGPRFRVAVIPETLERTHLGTAREGQRVHLEADVIGKWVERMLAASADART